MFNKINTSTKVNIDEMSKMLTNETLRNVSKGYKNVAKPTVLCAHLTYLAGCMGNDVRVALRTNEHNHSQKSAKGLLMISSAPTGCGKSYALNCVREAVKDVNQKMVERVLEKTSSDKEKYKKRASQGIEVGGSNTTINAIDMAQFKSDTGVVYAQDEFATLPKLLNMRDSFADDRFNAYAEESSTSVTRLTDDYTIYGKTRVNALLLGHKGEVSKAISKSDEKNFWGRWLIVDSEVIDEIESEEDLMADEREALFQRKNNWDGYSVDFNLCYEHLGHAQREFYIDLDNNEYAVEYLVRRAYRVLNRQDIPDRYKNFLHKQADYSFQKLALLFHVSDTISEYHANGCQGELVFEDKVSDKAVEKAIYFLTQVIEPSTLRMIENSEVGADLSQVERRILTAIATIEESNANMYVDRSKEQGKTVAMKGICGLIGNAESNHKAILLAYNRLVGRGIIIEEKTTGVKEGTIFTIDSKYKKNLQR